MANDLFFDGPPPTFTLTRCNPHRKARGVASVELRAEWEDGDSIRLWMTRRDIAENRKQFGECDALDAALDWYDGKGAGNGK
jgi:hypothetical protein